jgi:hypothetical protein
VKGTTTLACHSRPTWLSSGTLIFRSKLNYPNMLANFVARKRQPKKQQKQRNLKKEFSKASYTNHHP